jgi:hypothetical protein
MLCLTLVSVHQTTSPSSIRHCLQGYRIFSNIRGVIRIRNWLPNVFTRVETPGVSTTEEAWLSVVFITGESILIGLQKNLLVQNTLGSQDSSEINTFGSLDSLVYLSPKSIFGNLFWCMFQIHQEVKSLMYSLPGVETPRCTHHYGVVLDTRESFYRFEGAHNNL